MSADELRLTEGTQRQVSDIDAQRMLVWVHQGKGGQDRLVPLALRVLEWWRASWRHPRPHPWMFPTRDGSAPLSPTSLQKLFNAVVRPSGIPQAASTHPLRHG